MAFLVRLFVCIAICGITLYAYIDKHNALITLQMGVPMLEKELQLALEENVRLQFAVEKFENPQHLMELLRKPEYGHLSQSHSQNLIIIEHDS